MKKTVFAGALALVLASPLAAGVVFEIETKDHDSSPQDMEVKVEGRNLKMQILPGSGGRGRGDAIFRGDRREMVVVDHDDKTYIVMDEAAIASIAGQVSGAMAQVQEALKNVPEDQRAMVEKMMKERMPQAAQASGAGRVRGELRKTGERAEKNGYPCVKYEVLNGGRKDLELWVTDWDNVEGGDEVADAFEDMADFFNEMLDAIADASGGFGGAIDSSLFEHMKEIDGFPVVTRDFDGGELEGESSLRSARRRTLDPAEFEPPAGYKRRSMLGN